MTLEPGDVFTVECQRTRIVGQEQHGDVITLVREKERSWVGTFFELVAMDDRHVVATIVYSDVHGIVNDKPRVLSLAEFSLCPIGPDVQRALGIGVAKKAAS